MNERKIFLLNEFIQLLPSVFFYIAIGYCYLHTYRFVRISDKKDSLINTLMEYILCGFIFKSAFSLFHISINEIVINLSLMMIAIAFGIIGAKIINSNMFLAICQRLKIQQTPEIYPWHEVGDKGRSVWVSFTDDGGLTYQGVLINTETYQRFPVIKLSYYAVYKDNEMCEDYSNDPTRVLIVDTSKYGNIRLKYQKNSIRVKDWDVRSNE